MQRYNSCLWWCNDTTVVYGDAMIQQLSMVMQWYNSCLWWCNDTTVVNSDSIIQQLSKDAIVVNIVNDQTVCTRDAIMQRLSEMIQRCNSCQKWYNDATVVKNDALLHYYQKWYNDATVFKNDATMQQPNGDTIISNSNATLTTTPTRLRYIEITIAK